MRPKLRSGAEPAANRMFRAMQKGYFPAKRADRFLEVLPSVLPTKRVPTSRNQGLLTSIGPNHNRPLTSSDFTNCSEGNAPKSPGYPVRKASGSGEEQFIVIPTVQSQLKEVERLLAMNGRFLYQRNLCALHARPDAAGSAQPREFAGQPVGEVHHRCRQASFRQPLA